MNQASHIFIGSLPTNFYLYYRGKMPFIMNELDGSFTNLDRSSVKQSIWIEILNLAGPSKSRYPDHGTKTVETLLKFKRPDSEMQRKLNRMSQMK